jgi:CRISPR-associated protein Csd1
VAKASENWFAQMFSPPMVETEAGNLEQDGQQVAKLRDALRKFAEGGPLEDLDPQLKEGVRFHILGLSPNAARLSVRFWLTDRFEILHSVWRSTMSIYRSILRPGALTRRR